MKVEGRVTYLAAALVGTDAVVVEIGCSARSGESS